MHAGLCPVPPRHVASSSHILRPCTIRLNTCRTFHVMYAIVSFVLQTVFLHFTTKQENWKPSLQLRFRSTAIHLRNYNQFCKICSKPHKLRKVFFCSKYFTEGRHSHHKTNSPHVQRATALAKSVILLDS